jgi:deoxyribose-phosphate aldolase
MTKLEREKNMFDVMAYNPNTFGKLFEGGSGVLSFHSPETVELGAAEAIKYNIRTICTSCNFIPLYKKFLEGTDIMVGGVFSYPWGDMSIEAKKAELTKVIELGADTLDGVINLSYLKSGMMYELEKELCELVAFARNQKAGIEIKFIVECIFVTDEELCAAARLIKKSGADFIKTQTGWAPPGPTARQIRLIREAVGPDFGIKGCARSTGTIEGAVEFFEAGANIIGEAAPRVVEGLEAYQAMIRRQTGKPA